MRADSLPGSRGFNALGEFDMGRFKPLRSSPGQTFDLHHSPGVGRNGCLTINVRFPIAVLRVPSRFTSFRSSPGFLVEDDDSDTFPVGTAVVLGGHRAHRHGAHVVRIQMKLLHQIFPNLQRAIC